MLQCLSNPRLFLYGIYIYILCGHISSDKTNEQISTPDSVLKDRWNCWVLYRNTQKMENDGITEHPEVERIHKNHQSPTLNTAQGIPKNHTMCPSALPKCFLNSWRIYIKDIKKKNSLIALQKARIWCETVLQHWKKSLKQNYKLDQFQKVKHKSLSCLQNKIVACYR